MNCFLSRFLLASLLGLAVLGPFPMCTVGASTQFYAPDVIFVKTVIETHLGEKFSIIPLKAGDSIVIQSVTEDKKNWLVEGALTRLALDRGIHVIRSIKGKETPQEGSYTLSFRLVDLALNCFAERRGPLRRAVTMRRVNFDAFLSLADASGHVVWTTWAHVVRSEATPSQYDARLEDTDFLRRNVIENESKLMELVVIGGVVSSLVYLLL